MSGQLLPEDTPLPCSSTIPDSTPVYSSFEQFKPGLQLLSNDPSSEDGRHVRGQQSQQPQQQQQQQQQQKKPPMIHDDTAPKGGTTDLANPCCDDSEYMDLLYIVDPAGKATVMNLTSPESASAISPPPAAAAAPVISEQGVPPVQHDGPNQTAYLPPLNAAFSPPFETPQSIAGSNSASAPPRTEHELEEANELDYEDKLMKWWPSPEADELKVERL
jgi:hypothetical protein